MPGRIAVALAGSHYHQTTAPFRPRSQAEVRAFFDDLKLIDPGVVHLPLWRPGRPGDAGEHPELIAAYGGVGCKR